MSSLSNSYCLVVAKVITAVTYGGLAWWLLAIIAWRRGRRSIIRQMALSMLLGVVEIGILKHFFHRERPNAVTLYEFWMPIHGLFADRYSFPSGHALLSFAAARIFLAEFRDWRGWLAMVSAFIVGLCRVYEGVHWASDFLAGAILGLLAAQFAITVLEAPNRRQSQVPLPEKVENGRSDGQPGSAGSMEEP